MPININNSKNRDAVVATEALNPKREIRYTDPKGRPVSTRKLLKTDVLHDLPELIAKKKKLEKVDDALIKTVPAGGVRVWQVSAEWIHAAQQVLAVGGE